MNIEKSLEGEWTYGRLFKWMFLIMLFFSVLGMIGGAMGLFSKVVSTPGRVISKTLDTDNVIQSYEWFYDVDAAYKARLSQVNQYKSFMSGEEDKSERYRIRIELAAMQQTCRDLATKYNANSEKMNKSIFKGWELPDTLQIRNCD
jgi:hypothetical protein